MQSQCAQVLTWLRAGKPLTPKMAMDLFGCYRLAARIENLRRAGHVISSKTITVTSRNGGLARVAEYRMEVAA